MKVLWVKAGGLVPLDLGGRIRSYHILKEMARKHEVTLFTFYAEHPDDAHPQLEGLFTRVVCCPLRLPAPRSLSEGISYVRCLFSTHPYTIAKFCQPQVAQRVRQLLREQKYDVVVCDFVIAAPVIPWEELSCPTVLFTHNVEALIWKRHYQTARNPLWKIVCRREYHAMERAERFYLARADHVLTVSEVDRDFFARFIDPDKVTVIPTGVDVDYFRPDLRLEGEAQPDGSWANTLVFTGAMDWMPNEDAIQYLLKDTWPRVRRQFPKTVVWVVGRSPSPRLKALGDKDPGVRVTGRVDDVRPYVRDASVYVVPLRIGSGTRLKIFEAMAMGKAIVSTSIGAEGLPVIHGQNILLADTPEDFAEAIVNLLRDPAARTQMGQQARRMVEEKYSWGSAALRVDQILVRLFEKS